MYKKFAVQQKDFKVSSYSDPGGIIKTCVAVARTAEGVAVRNTNDPAETTVFYTNDEWDAFLKGAKAGEFDRT